MVHGRRRGGQPSNTNSQKKIELPRDLDLSSPTAIRKFLAQTLVPAAISGQLGVRVVTGVTSALKVLLDSQETELLEGLDRRLTELEKAKKVI